MSIGVALGGGGAKGFAHIPLLEVFDEFGVRPHRLAGTSIGAIIGSVYASGMPAKRIRERVAEILPRHREGWLDRVRKIWSLSPSLLSGDWGPDGIWKLLQAEFGTKDTFEELEIPFTVVAADFWERSPVIFDSGDLSVAVRSSMALPGVFDLVEHEGRVLVDGGGVDPLPYTLLLDQCDLVVAIDVSGIRTPGDKLMPSRSDALFGMFDLMERSILAEQLKRRPPDLYLRPAIRDVKVLELHKADEIYEAAAPECEELREWLAQNASATAK